MNDTRDETARWIRLVFVDVFGSSNSVQIPAGRWNDTLASGEAFDGSALEGRVRMLEADMLLRPDPRTLVHLGGGVSRAMCAVTLPGGEQWHGDPRHALERILDRYPELAESWSLAAELEFYLLQPDGAPVDERGYFDDVADSAATLMRGLSDRLAACGVSVESWHHEAGPGQFEVDLGPVTAMELADALILTKEVVQECARAAGLGATFMARPFTELPGSGLHLHQRMWSGLVGLDGKLEPEGRAFVAGQLHHARALCALAAPTVNSYKRLHSGPEAPSAAVWAHSNRGALLRVSGYDGSLASVEYRGADPGANPYLLLAGLLVAGIDGRERDLELGASVEESGGDFDPASPSVHVDPLPRSLDDALDALLADDVIVDSFDAQLLQRLVDGRRAEAATYRGLVTEWERARYLTS